MYRKTVWLSIPGLARASPHSSQFYASALCFVRERYARRVLIYSNHECHERLHLYIRCAHILLTCRCNYLTPAAFSALFWTFFVGGGKREEVWVGEKRAIAAARTSEHIPAFCIGYKSPSKRRSPADFGAGGAVLPLVLAGGLLAQLQSWSTGAAA